MVRWIVIPAIILALVGCRDYEAEKAVCAQKFEHTADYLLCIKPIETAQRQEQEDDDDAAMISTSIMLTTAATIQ